MLYPVYVQVGDKKHAHGIEFPDFPGCFSAADDWQEINRMAQEAVECHVAGENLPIPAPTALEKLAADSRYQGGVWMLVDLDLTRIDPTPKRVNISLPGSLLSQIDSYAQTRHLTRSGFLAKAASNGLYCPRFHKRDLEQSDFTHGQTIQDYSVDACINQNIRVPNAQTGANHRSALG